MDPVLLELNGSRISFSFFSSAEYEVELGNTQILKALQWAKYSPYSASHWATNSIEEEFATRWPAYHPLIKKLIID